MPKIDHIHTNFTSGVVSPRLDGRVDVSRFRNSARQLDNFLINHFGNAELRPGTKFIAATKANGVARLIDFVHSNQQAYVLEFGASYVRFYKDGAQIESAPGVPYEIVSPYLAVDLPDISWCQSADVMYLTHPSYPPYKLSRTAHTSWTIAAVNLLDGPYLQDNADFTFVIQPSGIYYSITINSTKALFTANHANALFRLKHSGVTDTTKMDAVGVTSGPHFLYGRFTVELTPHQWTRIKSEDLTQEYFPWTGQVVLECSSNLVDYQEIASFFYSTKQEFVSNDIGMAYRLRCKEYVGGIAYSCINQEEHWGVVKIVGVLNSTTAYASVIHPLGDTTATANWREGAWSAHRGYPRACLFHQDRLWFCGTATQPLTLWASWVGDYENFAPEGDEADGALDLSINAREASAIQWALPYRGGIAIGTTSGEGMLSGGANNEVITSKNIKFDWAGNNGSATDNARPLRVGSSILFLHRGRRQIRELTYNVQSDGFSAPDLTQLYPEVSLGGIKSFAYSDSPVPRIWCVKEDGAMAALTYLRQEEVVGWTDITTDGGVESVVVIPSSLGADAGSDQVWVVVQRSINGATKRYVELLQDMTDEADTSDYWYLDSALSYSGAAATTITGLSHLAGETVKVLGDGMVLTDKVVSVGGTITLERACTKVIAGLGYTGTFKPSRIEAATQGGGTIQGLKKRIVKAWLRLYRSFGAEIGPDLNNLYVIPIRSPGMDMGDPVTPFSYDVEVQFSGGTGPSNAVDFILRQQQPLPVNILALILRVSVYDE